MDHYYLSAPLPNGGLLCLTQLTDSEIDSAVEEIRDPSGYFLFEKPPPDTGESIKILARAHDEDAVFWLCDKFGLH